MELFTRKWAPFKIGDLFSNFEQGKCKNASALKSGNYPYVGATNRNNGILKFVEYDKNLVTKGNCLIFISQGDGSAGYSIYKKEDIICGSTVIAAYADFINEYNGLFISCCSDMNQSKYSHGHARNLDRLKNDYIMLPIDNTNNPDFPFMEKYIKELLLDDVNLLKKYFYESFNAIRIKPIKSLQDKEWQAFNIYDIFPFIQRGKRLKNYDHKIGNIPYISSSKVNNGLSDFIRNKNGRKFSNCLTIANSGSVGATFYHDYEFIGSDHITVLKNDSFNKYIYLFLATVVSKLGTKYSFNREINDLRISKEKIMLPIDDNKNPDFEYMGQYIQNIMSEQYNNYIIFLE